MATYGKWITVEDGCELPNEWEGVIVATRTRTKIEKVIYINGEFLLLPAKNNVICPKKYMRIDVSAVEFNTKINDMWESYRKAMEE